MNINLDITDQDAANLAALHSVRSFSDGNDLLTQVVANSNLRASKAAVTTAITRTQDQAVVDACVTAVTNAGVSVPLPPIKIQPSGGATPATP